MNYFKTSTGERVSKSVIDRRVTQAKEAKLEKQFLEDGYNHCEECDQSTDTYLDCSHVIPVKECQESGRSELAWDENNINILCRKCHQKRDKLNLQFTK